MFWPGPTCYQIVFRITGRAWLVFWWVKTLWPRRKLNKCMYFIVFQMWGPKALIPQVVWKCFSLIKWQCCYFLFGGGQFLSISSPQKRTRIWTSVNHCLLPYHREIGDPSTQTSTNVKPYHFWTSSEVGRYVGRHHWIFACISCSEAGDWTFQGRRCLKMVNHVDLWILMPWKCQNFVKQWRSFFCNMSFGWWILKALHWTFWWDYHTLGSSSSIGP